MLGLSPSGEHKLLHAVGLPAAASATTALGGATATGLTTIAGTSALAGTPAAGALLAAAAFPPFWLGAAAVGLAVGAVAVVTYIADEY